MDPVATSVYEVAALRAAEERALARLGLAPGALMERAGAAALAVLRECWPLARRVLVLAGPGNNGGDGLVLARLARTSGLSVTVCAPHLTAAAPSAEVPAGAEDRALPLTRERLDAADVVVDALFGIGLNRPPAAPFDWLFEHTLFCAIPPARRDDSVAAAARWVRPGGNYLAVNYLQPRDETGPPFGTTIAELRRRFGPHFELVRHWRPRSFAGREGRERVFWWQKRV